MKKSIYAISGFIPSDEDIVAISIYKLIKYGNDEVRYGWITVNGEESNGIGTGTDSFGETDKDDALIQIHSYRDEHFKLLKCTFDEVLVHYNELKETLQAELDFKLNNK